MLAQYLPGSDVTQHSRIDRDQRDFQTFLGEQDFEGARRVYTEGGNSMKTTSLTLATALLKDFPAGSTVSQGPAVVGVLNKRAKAGDTELKVGVTSTCRGQAVITGDISGCLTAGDSLTLQGGNVGSVSAVQQRWRTLAGFSTEAEVKMSGQPVFELFYKYYGIPDYADELVRSALLGRDSGRSRIPFTFTDKEEVFRVESAQKGSAYWAVWMYVIREMEDAVSDCTADCQTCNEEPVHAWDEAWAFYAGSLEGSAGSSDGRLLYRLAEKRCKNFGTCGQGIAGVNQEVVAFFRQGQQDLSAGRCDPVREVIGRIVSLMTIPLIQGTLRYAYLTAGRGGAKERAEGAVFLGGILPRLDNCSSQDADTVRRLMWLDGSMQADSFPTVRAALERNYGCLGLDCTQVGALLDESTGQYLTGPPCPPSPSLSAGATAAIVIVIGLVILATAGAGWGVRRRRNPRTQSTFSLF